MKADCYVVGICGGTCSGKTTLARKLYEDLNRVPIYISQDSYYKDQSNKSADELKNHNFDHPESLDLDLLYAHLIRLKEAREIQSPNYCFKTHARLEDVQVIQPANVVIVEGTLIFSHSDLMDLFNLRVFVDVAADVRLVRRINRDCLERGRDIDSITEQYLKTVRPMHDQFIENKKEHSDIIINSDSFDEQKKYLETILINKLEF